MWEEGRGDIIDRRILKEQIWRCVRGWEFVDMLIFNLKRGSIMVKKLQWGGRKMLSIPVSWLTSWSRDGWHAGEWAAN